MEEKKEIINPKALTNEEFEKMKEDIQDITDNFKNDPELLTEFMAFKTQFYQFSVNNTLLIQKQNKYVTFVANFKQWEKLGYRINKGEKHIKILRPIESTKFERKQKDGKIKLESLRKATNDEKDKIYRGEIKTVTTTNFIPHQVFDISQTNCPKEDYPRIYSTGYASVEYADLYQNIKEYAQMSGFDVQEEKLNSIALHGFYRPETNTIIINDRMNDSKKISTICHELAHGVVYRTSTLSVPEKEFEAECLAVMLQRKFGFPVDEKSKMNINQYHSKLDKKNSFDTEKTLTRLSKTFKHVSGGVDQTLEKNGYTIGMNRTQNQEQIQGRGNNAGEMAKKVAENFSQNL